MSARSHIREADASVATALRPVVITVVAAKFAILSFLFASVAGLVPAPANADQSATAYLATDVAAE